MWLEESLQRGHNTIIIPYAKCHEVIFSWWYFPVARYLTMYHWRCLSQVQSSAKLDLAYLSSFLFAVYGRFVMAPMFAATLQSSHHRLDFIFYYMHVSYISTGLSWHQPETTKCSSYTKWSSKGRKHSEPRFRFNGVDKQTL